MRLKFLILALVASLVAVSAAVAKDHPGKGPKAGHACKARWPSFSRACSAPMSTRRTATRRFTMLVKRSNRHGRAYKKAGSATLMVDAKTRVNRLGAHNLGALAPNDRLLVTAKVCRADLKNGATPDLTARRVLAHPAKAKQQ